MSEALRYRPYEVTILLGWASEGVEHRSLAKDSVVFEVSFDGPAWLGAVSRKAYDMKLPSGDNHWTSLMVNQHWFR